MEQEFLQEADPARPAVRLRGAAGTPDFRRAAGRAGKGCRLH